MSEQEFSQEGTITKKERKLLRKQEKQEERERQKRQEARRRIVTIAIVILAVGGLTGFIGWRIATSEVISEEDIVPDSESLHWHALLEIYVHDEPVEIPANIGVVGNTMQLLHTHDATGVIHVHRFNTRIRHEELELANFFDSWGETLTSECVMGYCNGNDGQVKFIVNGEENDEFERYRIQDDDKIEIRFE